MSIAVSSTLGTSKAFNLCFTLYLSFTLWLKPSGRRRWSKAEDDDDDSEGSNYSDSEDRRNLLERKNFTGVDSDEDYRSSEEEEDEDGIVVVVVVQGFPLRVVEWHSTTLLFSKCL